MKILPVTLGVALLVLGSFAWVNWKPRREAIPVQSLNTWQEADSPTGFPVNSGEGLRIPPLDFQMDLFRGSQRYRIPLAVRFDMPMGAANGALTYNAQSFWEMNERRGGRHTGDDLNGIGGMDTDLRDPVFAVADGLVVYAGEPSPGWGKILVLAHRTQNGRILQSMHAHLDSISVALDQMVVRGQRVARVGGADGLYPAHLHFEMHESQGLSLGAGYVTQRTNRLDPRATITSLRNALADDLGESVASVVRRISRESGTGF